MRWPPIDSWRLLLDPTGQSGAENMAFDTELLAEAGRTGRAFLRLYRFDPPCLSFGRHEPARSRYDRTAIARLGIDVVRRPTGGRAVWHEHEVTYAVAAPAGAFGDGTLRASYRAIHARLARALRTAGVPATLAPDRQRSRSTAFGPPACFATAAGSEVLVAGRKLIGSAQLRIGGAFLQHGSILLDGSQEMVRRVSREPAPGSGETTLSVVLGRRVFFDEVAAAIITVFGVTAITADRLRPPASAAFLDPAWTWRR